MVARDIPGCDEAEVDRVERIERAGLATGNEKTRSATTTEVAKTDTPVTSAISTHQTLGAKNSAPIIEVPHFRHDPRWLVLPVKRKFANAFDIQPVSSLPRSPSCANQMMPQDRRRVTRGYDYLGDLFSRTLDLHDQRNSGGISERKAIGKQSVVETHRLRDRIGLPETAYSIAITWGFFIRFAFAHWPRAEPEEACRASAFLAVAIQRTICQAT